MSVRIAGLAKSFGGTPVLGGVSLEIAAGEIHALLGPNGAGKSTFIRCLGGAIRPDAGEIWIEGRRYAGLTPTQAAGAGIAVIYQHLNLVNTLTVAENIFLGSERRRGPFIRQREQREAAARLLAELFPDVAVSPDARVGDLPMATRQLVAIARAMQRADVRLLILDEPTAALSLAEAAALADRLRSLRARGLHILYITHFLREVFDVADSVTVLRDGRVVFQQRVAATREAELIGAIVGGQGMEFERSGEPPGGAPVLELERLAGERFGPLSLTVAGGEIVGVFGPLGSGRTELLETIFGARRAAGGVIRVGGEAVAPDSPAAAIRAGVALVPGERLRQGIFASLSASDNMLLRSYSRLARLGVRAPVREQRHFQILAERMQLRPAVPGLLARHFSGGNQQKLVVGRWLNPTEKVTVLLMDEPTQGVDVGARREMYRIMRETVAGGGRGILFTSSDPEEVVAVAHRALVLHRGVIAGELRGPDLTEDRLMSLAHASTPGPAGRQPK